MATILTMSSMAVDPRMCLLSLCACSSLVAVGAGWAAKRSGRPDGVTIGIAAFCVCYLCVSCLDFTVFQSMKKKGKEGT